MSPEEGQHQAEETPHIRRRFNRIGVLLLVAGLPAAVLVRFWTAPDSGGAPLSYEIDGSGNTYAIMPSDSKAYEHDVEEIGGKSAVLAIEFNHWLGSLWHGRRLAYTLASLSVGGALACFFLARRLGDPLPQEAEAAGNEVKRGDPRPD